MVFRIEVCAEDSCPKPYIVVKIEGFEAAVGVIGIARHANAKADMAFENAFARGMDFMADAFDERLMC